MDMGGVNFAGFEDEDEEDLERCLLV